MSANIAKILWYLYSISVGVVEMQTCPFTDLHVYVYKRADPGLLGWGGGGHYHFGYNYIPIYIPITITFLITFLD